MSSELVTTNALGMQAVVDAIRDVAVCRFRSRRWVFCLGSVARLDGAVIVCFAVHRGVICTEVALGGFVEATTNCRFTTVLPGACGKVHHRWVYS